MKHKDYGDHVMDTGNNPMVFTCHLKVLSHLQSPGTQYSLQGRGNITKQNEDSNILVISSLFQAKYSILHGSGPFRNSDHLGHSSSYSCQNACFLLLSSQHSKLQPAVLPQQDDTDALLPTPHLLAH